MYMPLSHRESLIHITQYYDHECGCTLVHMHTYINLYTALRLSWLAAAFESHTPDNKVLGTFYSISISTYTSITGDQ